MSSNSATREIATLAGGCFWCLEAAYVRLMGVEKVESGYMGGEVPNPSYQAVCSGRTGHAEVVQVTFDPAVIGFSELLDVFFGIHDPTTLNRQGNDVGTQYRSAIFFHDQDQQRIAEDKIRHLAEEGVFDDAIVTEVSPAARFYVAEQYHQQYFEKNPDQPYCRFVVGPKVDKLRKVFASRLKRS